MSNAKNFPCEILFNTDSTKYLESIRIFQGCPTIAATKKGRIYLGWYAGGTQEPHLHNYNLLIYSDDNGKNWSKPVMIIPSSYSRLVQALDIQLFIDPMDKLHVCWVQNNVLPYKGDVHEKKAVENYGVVDGYVYCDCTHAGWEVICENPDDENPVFSEPRYIHHGFLRCKPTFLKNGGWLCFAYDQLTDKYGYAITNDGGKTYTYHYGPKKITTVCDETMAYQLEDGSIRMFARSREGEIAESYSYDNGLTWTETRLSGIDSPDTRFFVSRLPSGRIILISNDDRKERKKMTVRLSEDDGKTWKYKHSIDEREHLSYPDADFHDGKIYLTYDRGRTSHREILFCSFTEQDIIDKNEIEISIVSKPPVRPEKDEVIKKIKEEKLIAIVRGVEKEKILPLAQALYDGGIRLMEVTYSADGSVSDLETADIIRMLSEKFSEKMLIGAGTVLTDEQVRLTKAAGGLFIISPNVNEQVIRETYRCGLVSIPGALTPTEIVNAKNYRADFVKLFPVSAFGADYVKAVKAPLSDIDLLAVGGVNEANMADYLKAGVCGFGIGSNITDKKMIENNDFDGITKLAKKFTEAVK